MDNQWRPSMFCLVSLVLTLGVTIQGLEKECYSTSDTKFPFMVRAILNITSQSEPVAADVRKGSLSPWDISYDVDNHRYPSTIVEARCQHDRCVDKEGSVDHSGNSVPIRHEILVLQWKMKRCNPVFKLMKKMVTVGCICVQPNNKFISYTN
uniref:Uncharacterized protein n=1 Tax=Leptobrachium leishanense TaxID=445787 RepID=A0A8C5MLM1_9ANUR